jgi:hypothetical protein
MAGDTRQSEQVELVIKYSHELSEDIPPEPGTAEAVISPEEFTKVKKWHVNRVFYFLICSTVICLATVAIVPNFVVEEAAVGVWIGSVGLARYLLAGAYRKSEKAARPET